MRSLVLMAVLLSAVGSGAYFKGRADEFREQNAVQIKINEALFAAEEKRLAAERKLLDLQEEITHEAAADPDAGRVSFGADSLRRLNQIR